MADVANDLLRISKRQEAANPDLARELEALSVVARQASTDPTSAMFDRLVRTSEREEGYARALDRNTAVLERVANALERRSAPPDAGAADSEDTVEVAAIPDSHAQPQAVQTTTAARDLPTWSEGAVNVIEALSKLVAAFPWPMWVVLGLCALGAVVGAYNLTYTGDYGTLGGSATAEKVNAVEDDVDADSGGGGGLVLPMPQP